MKKTDRVFSVVPVLLCGVLFLALGLTGSQTNSQRSLSHADYDSWISINGSKLSNDGKWALYIETPQVGEAVLVVRRISNGKDFRFSIGYSGEGTESHRQARPEFTFDSRFVVFLASPTREEVNKAKKDKAKDKDKPKKKLGIMDLSTGEVRLIERVKNFALPEKAGGWVAVLKEALPEPDKREGEEKEREAKAEESEDEKKEKGKRDYGTQLLVVSLSEGFETEYPDVLNYIWAKNGKSLFYAVSSQDHPESDGIYRLESGSDEAVPLMTGKGRYDKLTLDDSGLMLAFLSDREFQDSDQPTFQLYGWSQGETAASLWVSHTSTLDFPEGMAVSHFSGLEFVHDGEMVTFGIKEIHPPDADKEEDEEDVEETAEFDLWHWDDPYPQPQQMKMVEEMKEETWKSVFFIKEKRFVKLADHDAPEIAVSKNGRTAFSQNIRPYSKKVSYDGNYYDIYSIDPVSGKKMLVKKELYGGADLSPDGKYIYWFIRGDWYIHDISSAATVNITEPLGVDFNQHDWDRPEPKRSYGRMGWTDDDNSFLIYDRFDIWEIKPDGTGARMITEGFGRKNNLSLRYLRLDSEEESIDPGRKYLFKGINQDTMDQSLFRDGIIGDREPELLYSVKRSIPSISKAKNSNIYLFSRSTFEEYPDLWAAEGDFSNPRRLTDYGSQMKPFIWGRSEMRDFLSSDGFPLKGILIKPENFDPKKQYPLMVYIYETLHQGRHNFRNPSPGSSVNTSYYVSNGYIIWMPDIEYETGYPGKDALKCVLPGIQMLVDEGYINPKAIGIQGHSWGGYQISYMITQTNIFAAAEAGAPVSNMTSAYGGIRWASGMVRQFQYERTQSRLGDSLWAVPLRYVENSPLFWADKIKTPLMIMHNDEDGAVPWYQGIELIMAMRRLRKEAYMFNYNGEAHGLRKRANQTDWTIRMAEFFDHFLKGAEKPDWMKKGIKAWEKKTP